MSAADYQKRKGYFQENMNSAVNKAKKFVGAGDSSATTDRYCHAVGSSKHHVISGSWIGLWERESFMKRGKCLFYKCQRDATLGAHVQLARHNTNDATWFIIPACKDCNNKWKKFENCSNVGPGALLERSAFPVAVAWHTKGTLGPPGRILAGTYWDKRADTN